MGVRPLSWENQSRTVSHCAETKETVTVFSGAVGAAVAPVPGVPTTAPGAVGAGMGCPPAGAWAAAHPAAPARQPAAATTPGSHLGSFPMGAPRRVLGRGRMEVPQKLRTNPRRG